MDAEQLEAWLKVAIKQYISEAPKNLSWNTHLAPIVNVESHFKFAVYLSKCAITQFTASWRFSKGK